jgi:enoyl-CoA hydratase/carnithine racemase
MADVVNEVMVKAVDRMARVKPVPTQSPVEFPPALQFRPLESLDAVVVTKTEAGFDAAAIEGLRGMLLQARLGRLGRLKFIVFDFAHQSGEAAEAAEAFDALVLEVGDIILESPIVTVAYARAPLAGADLEFALGCSMMVAEEDARFAFDADPIIAIGLYGFLAQKIGFVRAERLMEGGEVLSARQMHELLLLKEVIPAGAGGPGIETFLTRASRRHNASWGIYRAQRIASEARRARVA